MNVTTIGIDREAQGQVLRFFARLEIENRGAKGKT